MRVFIYAIFDSCAAVYDRPFVMGADGLAIRSFTDIACDAEHPIGAHPEHYSLWRIGTYDDAKAEIVPESAVCIARAHECVAASRKIAPGGLNKFEEQVKARADLGNGVAQNILDVVTTEENDNAT